MSVCFAPKLLVAHDDRVYSQNVNCDQVPLLYRTQYFDFVEAVLTDIMLWLPVRQGDSQDVQ